MDHASQGSGDDEAKIGFKASNGETKISGVLQNDVYGKSNVVTPEHIKVYVYIVVASTITGDYGTINIETLINTITSYQNAVIELNNNIIRLQNIKISYPDYSTKIQLPSSGTMISIETCFPPSGEGNQVNRRKDL